MEAKKHEIDKNENNVCNKILTGTASMDMELILGMDLTGYIGRSSGATGIHDQLKIKCMAFSDESTIFVLVACPLLGLSGSFVNEVCNLAEKKLGIPASNIIISCTHTHSGPASIFLQDCGEVDEAWMQDLKDRILMCIGEATANLKPSSVTYETTQSRINLNRVQYRISKDLVDGVKYTDNQVGIVSVFKKDSKFPETMVINYACHPVVLPNTNLLYTADFPYYVEKALQREIHPKLNVLYTNGCCGDLIPIKKGNYEVAEEIGEQLASDIIAKFKNM